MQAKFFDFNSTFFYHSVLSEDDLKLKKQTNINPPPKDGRCMCCGKHIRDLQLFKNPNNPSSDSLERAKLWKHFRPIPPYKYKDDIELQNAINHIYKHGYFKIVSEEIPMDLFVKFGKREGVVYVCCISSELNALLFSSWECKDCYDLGNSQYHKNCKYGLQI